MATKNAKLMEKKITKPTISKPSNTVIRKVDKPRTAMAVLKKEEKGIKSRDIGIGKPYEATRRYNRDNELKANREKQAAVQKVIDSRTKVNNKAISKSLGSVANNRGMKKSDVKGTVKLAEKKLSAAEQNLKKISNTKVRTSAGQSTIGKSRAYELSREDNKRYNDAQKAVSMAKKNLKSLNKTASRRK